MRTIQTRVCFSTHPHTVWEMLPSDESKQLKEFTDLLPNKLHNSYNKNKDTKLS